MALLPEMANTSLPFVKRGQPKHVGLLGCNLIVQQDAQSYVEDDDYKNKSRNEQITCMVSRIADLISSVIS